MEAVVYGKLRSIISLALMLWCAGAGCMVVSYAQGGAMTGPATPDIGSRGASWGLASGSMGTHDCCKARHKSERRIRSSRSEQASSSATEGTELAKVPAQTNAMSCCPLTSGTFVIASRQRVSNEDAPLPKGLDAISIVPGSRSAAPPSYARHLPSQSQTHLRLCVFLI
jgi:hypothetical protein